MRIFIPGNVPSSKNSKRIIRLKNGDRKIINSKYVFDYHKATRVYWEQYRGEFLKATMPLDKPMKIEFQFARLTRRKFDFVNLAQLPLDLMTTYKWIEDDDFNNVVPVFNPEVIFDKENPGLYIKVLEQ